MFARLFAIKIQVLSSLSTIVRPLTHASALLPRRDNDQEQQ